MIKIPMTKALVLFAALAFGVSAASACEFNRSAKSTDKTTVASITGEAAPVSTPEQSTPADVKVPAVDKEG